MTTYAILTLGCKVNAYESECYSEALNRLGYEEVNGDAVADVYIINTCTVTNTAAQKSRQKIHMARRLNPHAILCAVGCLAQTDERVQLDESVDLVIGSAQKNQLADRIAELLQERKRLNLVVDVQAPRPFEALYTKRFAHQHRAYLKIQDGCNQFCSYCVIPYARGRERSLPLKDVVETASMLVAQGHKEIVLSGIHTGRYADKEYRLIDVLRALLKLDLQRIRISSIEITEITDEMIALFQNEPRLARHLHIPLQSGSDTVLKRMNRPYDTTYYLDRVETIRKAIPDIALGTDMIVGFPGETEKEFQESKRTCQLANLAYLHVFPYSLRNHTVAAGLPDQISSVLKKERVKELIALGEKQKEAYWDSLIGKELTVLFEKEENGVYYGHSSEYALVAVKHLSDLRGGLYNVTVSGCEKQQLRGVIKEKTHEIK